MNDYERLMKDFCVLANLRDHASVAAGAPIEVDGVTCSITAGRQNEANAVVLYIEFGSVPAGREAAIFEELMVQNYVGAPDAGVVFGFSPVAKHVVCIQHLRVNEISPQRLVDILHHIAVKAVEWRRTYFLKSSETRAPGGGLPASGGARALLSGARALGAAKTIPR
jgi:hypothetical protein